MNEISKLEKEIANQLEQLQIQLSQLEFNDANGISNNIYQLTNFYQEKGKLDFSLLEPVLSSLHLPNLKSVEEYKKIALFLEYCQKNNVNGNFDYDIQRCSTIVKTLMDELSRYYTKLMYQIRNIGFKKRIINEQKIELETSNTVLTKYRRSEIVSPEELEVFCSFLKTVDNIDQKKLLTILLDITNRNVQLMDEKINQAMIEQKKRRLKEELAARKKKDAEKKKASNRLEKVDSVKLETPMELQGEHLEIYNRAKEIAEQVSEVPSSVEVTLSAIKIDLPWKQRKQIYYSLLDNEQDLLLISVDLKTQLLPFIEKGLKDKSLNLEIFSLLSDIIKEYENIKWTIEKEQVEHRRQVIEEQNKSYKETMEQISLFYEQAKELKENRSKIYYTKGLNVTVEKLEQLINEYKEWLKEFTEEPNEEYQEILESEKENIVKAYKNFEQSYQMSMTLDGEEELIYRGKTFYDTLRPLKNIFVFVDDNGEEISVMEKDIENDNRFDASTYTRILNKLQFVACDNFTTTSNHLAKMSDNYSSEFLEKYHVRRIQEGNVRIFYSLFPANLSPFFKGENPNVIYIYSVGYGYASKTKSDINYDALKICKDNTQEIDKVIELLNTDWSSLSEDEKGKKGQQVQEYLNRQYLKLGHFIETTEKKQEEVKEGKHE